MSDLTIRTGDDEIIPLEEPVRVACDFGDGEELVITITHEGIILDAYRHGDEIGTIGMTFDEWHDHVRTA